MNHDHAKELSPDKFLATIADGLRHAIRDHGPITKELIGSAAKRVWARIKNTKYDPFKPVRPDGGAGEAATRFVEAAFTYLNTISGTDICENRTCIRCRIADAAFEVERKITTPAVAQPTEWTEGEALISLVAAKAAICYMCAKPERYRPAEAIEGSERLFHFQRESSREAEWNAGACLADALNKVPIVSAGPTPPTPATSEKALHILQKLVDRVRLELRDSNVVMADEQLSGRELDAMVAERVMGWERVEMFNHILNPDWFSNPAKQPMYVPGSPSDYLVRPGRMAERDGNVIAREAVGDLTIGGDQDLPRYSESIVAAMQVVEKMRELWEIEITTGPGGGWMIRFSNGEPLATTVASGPDLPDVICRGALNARLRTKNNSQM